MKIIQVTPIFLILLLTLVPLAAIGGGDHSHEGEDVAHTATDHCETADAELTIEASESALDYDKDEYQVQKNTCYELTFENPSMTDHDVNIDHDEDLGFEEVHVHVANHTDGDHGVRSMHIMTPDADTELTIYCSVAGHQSSGMEALLVVGDGADAPFNIFSGILGIIFLAIAVPILRRTKR